MLIDSCPCKLRFSSGSCIRISALVTRVGWFPYNLNTCWVLSTWSSSSLGHMLETATTWTKCCAQHFTGLYICCPKFVLMVVFKLQIEGPLEELTRPERDCADQNRNRIWKEAYEGKSFKSLWYCLYAAFSRIVFVWYFTTDNAHSPMAGDYTILYSGWLSAALSE